MSKQDQIPVKLFRPFGPPIMEIDMPEDVIKNVNDYVEKTTQDKKKIKELDVGDQLAGQVTQEISLEKNFYESHFKNFLTHAVQSYIFLITNRKIKNFELKDCWVVRQYENEYNPNHYHSGHLSGVGYLKLPKSFGESKQSTKNVNKNGMIEFVHGAKMFLSGSQKLVKPAVGKFYVFPHYLMHVVYPFKGKGERRSISFNGEIDQMLFLETYGGFKKIEQTK